MTDYRTPQIVIETKLSFVDVRFQAHGAHDVCVGSTLKESMVEKDVTAIAKPLIPFLRPRDQGKEAVIPAASR